MHTHDLGRDRIGYGEVLSAITQPVLVVSVSTDTLYPPEEQLALAQALPNARYEVLDCPHGHDGFLIETDKLGDMITRFRQAGWASPGLQAISAACR
jgi:homoserine O-acetyltransferase